MAATADAAQALAPFIEAAERYDRFVEESTNRLQKLAPPVESHPLQTGTAPAPTSCGATAASPFTGAPEAATSAHSEIPPAVSSRVHFSQHSAPRVDNLTLSSCRGPGQLATVLVPALRALGASEGLIEGLKLLAAGAPPLPTP